MGERPKRGRPLKQGRIVRPEYLYVRLTADEKRTIEAAANCGSVVEWCRRELLGAARRNAAQMPAEPAESAGPKQPVLGNVFLQVVCDQQLFGGTEQ